MATRLCATPGCYTPTADPGGLCSHCRCGAQPRPCATAGCQNTAHTGHTYCSACRRVIRHRAADARRQQKQRDKASVPELRRERREALAERLSLAKARQVIDETPAANATWLAAFRSC